MKRLPQKFHRQRGSFSFFMFLIGLFVVGGCSADNAKGHPPLEKKRETQLILGTIVHVDVCFDPQEDEKVALGYQKVWDRMRDIHARMNAYDAQSEVSMINRSFGQPVAVSQDTYDVIQKSLQYGNLTRGAFDITVGALIQLWKKAEEERALPSSQEIEAVRQAGGEGKIRLHKGHKVELMHPLTRIDLGAVAKGYAVDEAARILRENGLNNFYIDAGGDLYVSGKNCQGEKWRIGIKDPIRKTLRNEILELENQAVTTSGNYEQFYVVEGRRLSHIMNPLTGYPQDLVLSATVVAPTAMEADILSTAFCVLDPEDSLGLLESLGSAFAGMFIVRDQGDQIRDYRNQPFEKLLSLRKGRSR